MLLAGAILTETIFSWPGIGKWMVDSVFRRDYPAVQGGLLLIAVIVMLVNLSSTSSTASSIRASGTTEMALDDPTDRYSEAETVIAGGDTPSAPLRHCRVLVLFLARTAAR